MTFTAYQTVEIIIALYTLLVFFLMRYLLTKKPVDEFYSDSYKAALAIKADVKAFNTVRPASVRIAIDAVNKSRDLVEEFGADRRRRAIPVSILKYLEKIGAA